MPDEQTSGPQVTDDGLGKALDELLKAADATSLAKGATHSGKGSNSVETGGHVDEDGTTSGTLAGSGDVGGIDTLMVAKMSAAGIPAGIINAFSAFMSKEDEEDEDEGDEDEDEKENPFDKSLEPSFQKSMDAYREDSDLSDTIDVSPFLEALTARTADQLDAIRKSAGAFEGQQNHVNQKLAGALHQIGGLLKSQTGVIQALGERLNLVERTPAPQKGATQLSGAQPLHKALPGELGQGGQELRKSEILSTLTYMNLEKGMHEINGQRTSELVGLFEGGNVIDEKTVGAVRSFLQTHPNEADAARQYA
jgi:hypothetical protein